MASLMTMDGSAPFGAAAAPPLDREMYAMVEKERERYAAFFATLEEVQPQQVACRDVEAFYNKSSLQEPEVQELCRLIKAVRVQPDADVMNETEFCMGMHLIVCRTKRGLPKFPSVFPTYLFPTLHLPVPVETAPITAAPSPPLAQDGLKTLRGSTTLLELLHHEVHNKRVQTSVLDRVEQSEARTLQHLYECLTQCVRAVQTLGVPVQEPIASAVDSVSALNELANQVRRHVQATKQEIQQLQIAEQMRSVAEEATAAADERRRDARLLAGNGSSSRSLVSEDAGSGIATIATLTQQLTALQHETAALTAKRDALARKALSQRVMLVTQSSVTMPTEPTTTALPNVIEPVVETAMNDTATTATSVANSTKEENIDSFGWGAMTPPVEKPAQPQEGDDFGWGAFQ